MTMNIALIGSGRMGTEIERAAKSQKIAVKRVFTIEDPLTKNNRELLDGVDVAIDFSTASAVLANVEHCAARKTNIVIGTTGWQSDRKKVEQIVAKARIGMLHSANFSLGMNLFFEIAATASELFNDHEMYDAAISEIHHSKKTDSPSGTALTLGAIVLEHLKRKRKILAETSHGQIQPGELHITSTRVGDVAGTHRLLFDSAADSIELIHTAKNRSGFALGALLAAEWLKGKKGVFTMKDVLRSKHQ
jgi:4-hydroxy-tetrahydrodipicolinate reductase